MQLDSTVMDAIHAVARSRVTVSPGSADFGVAFEQALKAVLDEVGVHVMQQELREGDRGDVVVEQGTEWVCVVRSPTSYICRHGEVRVERGLYRAVRNGPTRCFVEERFGIFDRWTPDAARVCALLTTDLTSRQAERFFSEQGGMQPSRSALERLPTRVGDTIEANREAMDAELRRACAIPEAAVAVAVMLDGVMVRLQVNQRSALVQAAKEEGRKVGGPVGCSEASVGTLSFYDSDGERLMTRRFARMPEEDKAVLKDILRKELAHVRAVRPDLIVVALSDGAPNNWSFLESLDPDHQIVDAFHTLEHVKRRLDDALGAGSRENQQTYAALKDLLLCAVNGAAVVSDALDAIEKKHGTYKVRKTTGRGAQPTFFERHIHRMPYVDHRAWRLPLGSGVVEGTARYMVVDRLRRTGMRWKQDGGQAILTLRQWAANDQFNDGWNELMHLEAARRRAAWADSLAA